MAKLKSENKDQLLVAFLAKQTPQTKKPCMSSYRTMLYPVMGKSCWVLVYILSLACGTIFQVLTLKIWLQVLFGRVPCLRAGLLSGMALQLVLTTLLLSDAFRTGFIDASHFSLVVVYSFRSNNKTWIICVVGTSVLLCYSEHGL